MNTPDGLSVVGADIRTWPKPREDDLPETKRANYAARCKALTAVVGGSSFRSAAQQTNVDARTIQKDAHKALELGTDGNVWGFRACTPFANRTRRRKQDVEVQAPTHKRAYAFAQLLQCTPRGQALVDKYTGPLPSGKRKSRRFDRHFREFLAIIRSTHGEKVYPFHLPDQGRRALLKYHKRVRQARHDAGAAETEGTEPRITRFSQLFTWQPLDRLEYDAHKIDVDWELEMVRPDGHIVLRKIDCINYLPVLDAASRYLVAHVLVLGAYNQLDVLRLFHRTLVPWTPRVLIVNGMAYPEGAQLGLPFDSAGCCPRAILIAGDNARAHHANLAVENITEHHRGIYNLGRAHVPEGRPIVEAFFRRLEQGALRNIAGGFHPQSRTTGKVSTSYLRGADHPLHWEALLDLIDVIGAGYNVTPHSGLHNRTPLSVMDTHLKSGWSWHATEAARDARALTTIRFGATIGGNQAEGRQPYVQYHEARYRSQRLMGQWHLLKKRFPAEADIEDLRHIVLLDPSDGTPWSRLSALPPWDRTQHDLHLRQQVIRARNRGLIEIVGSTDAIAVFHAFTREQAISHEAPPDLYARIQAQQPSRTTPPAASDPNRPTVLPRNGRTSFANFKD